MRPLKSTVIVERARQAGQKYVDSFKGNWKALAEDLNRRG